MACRVISCQISGAVKSSAQEVKVSVFVMPEIPWRPAAAACPAARMGWMMDDAMIMMMIRI